MKIPDPFPAEVVERWKGRDHVVLVADLHLHDRPGWRFQWCERFLDQLLDMRPHAVALLGDVFELRNPPAEVANLFVEWCIAASASGTQVVWIVGQHDSVRPGRASLPAVGLLDGVLVIDREPLWVELLGVHVWCVPYTRDELRVVDAINLLPLGTRYVLTHLPVRPFVPNAAAHVDELASVGVPIVSGDYHHGGAADVGHWIYVGAPSQRDWRDAGVRGRVMMLTPDGELRPEYTCHPLHVTDSVPPHRDDVPVLARSAATRRRDAALHEWIPHREELTTDPLAACLSYLGEVLQDAGKAEKLAAFLRREIVERG